MGKEVGTTELQEILQELIDRGVLDLRQRKTIQFPCSFKKGFEEVTIEEITQDQRALNAMKRAGIMSAGALIEKFDDIGRLRNVGKKTVALLRVGLIDAYYRYLDTADKKAQFLKQVIEMNSGKLDPVVEAE